MPKHVKINEHGRRIGESHPRAVLSDHEAGLILDLLAEREALVFTLRKGGACQAAIDAALTGTGLSYRCLAAKFEVHKQTIAKIARGEKRCQTVARVKAYP